MDGRRSRFNGRGSVPRLQDDSVESCDGYWRYRVLRDKRDLRRDHPVRHQGAGTGPGEGQRQGGTIAIGHPLACSGPMLTCSLARILKEKGARYDMATLCGGVQEGANLIEAIQLRTLPISKAAPAGAAFLLSTISCTSTDMIGNAAAKYLLGHVLAGHRIAFLLDGGA
ncbi:MAG: hypothetical protein SWK76_05060 [Actinomycetota bacterium]|nr:hypothetical protein [Actinomycetota bacterium]